MSCKIQVIKGDGEVKRGIFHCTVREGVRERKRGQNIAINRR